MVGLENVSVGEDLCLRVQELGVGCSGQEWVHYSPFSSSGRFVRDTPFCAVYY